MTQKPAIQKGLPQIASGGTTVSAAGNAGNQSAITLIFNRFEGSRSLLRRFGLQRQRVQVAAHLALQGAIDELVLLHAVLAVEGG